ncbi:hypothetical protein SKC41_29140 [Mycobacterium sp. 050128]|uniref:hypothetical protein n=1 Tax=unclassified Mycobacterium TaxID=2642494 RepID=UPI002ED8149F
MNWPTPPAPPQRNKAVAIAIGTSLVATVIAIAALIVGIIDLTRPTTSASPTTETSVSTPARQPNPSDIAAANRALCGAIAPMTTESDRISKAYSSLGPAGSPTYSAGVSTFMGDTRNWVGRIQPVIDGHSNVDPYLLRSLQRFVDDRRYLIADLEEGEPQPYDQTDWNDSLSAYNGPLVTCWNVVVNW